MCKTAVLPGCIIKKFINSLKQKLALHTSILSIILEFWLAQDTGKKEGIRKEKYACEL